MYLIVLLLYSFANKQNWVVPPARAIILLLPRKRLRLNHCCFDIRKSWWSCSRNWVCSIQEGEMITCSLQATLRKAEVSELIKTAQPWGFAGTLLPLCRPWAIEGTSQSYSQACSFVSSDWYVSLRKKMQPPFIFLCHVFCGDNMLKWNIPSY